MISFGLLYFLSLLGASYTVAAVDQPGNVCSDLYKDHKDRVLHLPGYNQPLPSRWFSGYLDYDFQGQKVHTHYVLIEAEQVGDNNSQDEPLIYWSNGGYVQ